VPCAYTRRDFIRFGRTSRAVPRALGETPVDVEEQKLPGVNPVIELPPPRAVPGLIIGRTACLGHASMGWKGAGISLNSKPAWAPLFCLSLELKQITPLS
jgi:hypothetical protein